MRRGHFIALDVHCTFCEMAVVGGRGQVLGRQRCETTIVAVRQLVEAVPRPRHLVIEEGPLADWLYRNVHASVDSLTVSEPRRNRLIAEDGDKDDPVDAEKLAQLLRGGYVKAVHHTDSEARTIFKQHVALYHWSVRQRVRQAHVLSSLLRRHGIMVRERDYAREADRPPLLERLPAQALLRDDVKSMWQCYEAAVTLEETLRQRLARAAQENETICRFEALPGFGWVRAATLYAYLDTPWRFASKQALWKYLGIGLERHRSGNGPERVGVPWRCNRMLKDTILGAAKSAVTQGKNPFADQHRRWLEQGLSSKLARRNVARSLAATLWGLWKNGSVYHPEWVGVTAAAIHQAEESR